MLECVRWLVGRAACSPWRRVTTCTRRCRTYCDHTRARAFVVLLGVQGLVRLCNSKHKRMCWFRTTTRCDPSPCVQGLVRLYNFVPGGPTLVPLEEAPSYRQGFGRINLQQSLPLPGNGLGWSLQVRASRALEEYRKPGRV